MVHGTLSGYTERVVGMTTAVSRRTTIVALSGWLAFAVVWMQQQPATPPPPAAPPTVLVGPEADAVAAGLDGGAVGGSYASVKKQATEGALSRLIKRGLLGRSQISTLDNIADVLKLSCSKLSSK